MTAVRVTAADRFSVVVTAFEPAVAARAVVVINSATAARGWPSAVDWLAESAAERAHR